MGKSTIHCRIMQGTLCGRLSKINLLFVLPDKPTPIEPPAGRTWWLSRYPQDLNPKSDWLLSVTAKAILFLATARYG